MSHPPYHQSEDLLDFKRDVCIALNFDFNCSLADIITRIEQLMEIRNSIISEVKRSVEWRVE